jgi:hypothetical protein
MEVNRGEWQLKSKTEYYIITGNAKIKYQIKLSTLYIYLYEIKYILNNNIVF